ncbi:MAG: EamA family transporter [Rhodospirillaceae bacterium]|nr:EamA family transporter [Rhodospirillaceae bacterium]MDD9916557.1 EamA family transporter [Rhodospirillaceae bacterium]MDD9927453.1 EamA family transporter [Rhodospirillaceae bacterium]
MNLKFTIFIIMIVAGISAGQILFKKTSDAVAEGNLIVSLLSSVTFWVAITLYGVCTLLWIFALKHVPLSIAYSLFSLSFIIVPTLSYFILNEPVTWRIYAGGAFILLGVTVIFTSPTT